MGLRRGKSDSVNNGASLIALLRGSCGGLPNVQVALDQLFAGGGGTTSADLTALTALPATVGGLVYVETLLCYFRLNPVSTLTPDGITVVAASGGGNWERLVATTALDWLAQSSWRIDSAAGNDENSGDAANPLASLDELMRRLSVGELQQNVTVTIAEGSSLGALKGELDLGDYNIVFQGEATVVATDTVSSWTARVEAAPSYYQLKATGVGDWSSYVGNRVQFTSGNAANHVTWVVRANPQGAGFDVARITLQGEYPYATPGGDPAPGDSLNIETLPRLTDVVLRVRGRHTTYPVNRVVLRDVSVGPQLEVEWMLGDIFPAVNIYGCLIETGTADPSYSVVVRANALQRLYVGGCLISSAGGAAFRGASAQSCAFTGTYGIEIRGRTPINNCLFDACPWLVYDPSNTAHDCGFFDTGASAIQVFQAGVVVLDSSVYGNGHAIGLELGVGSSCPPIQVRYNQTQNLVGTTSDIRINGSTDLDLSWSDMPYDGNAQKGTQALIGGTATVIARGANARGVIVSKDSPAGNPQGTLSAPNASRTPTQFVVNAVDTTGALVPTDGSIFDWYIPPEARGVSISDDRSNAASG